ncbi:MAG: response regulator transcription factor [Chloroflexi bacterium]|nr:response regulator transcription factor [Chloroflexota bacterium]MBU1748989.1 response regulator transcription factor [Chloroflexota bacterium]
MSPRCTVLVVDDEPGLLDVVQMYFAREGFRVVLAADGEAALAAAAQELPDLIILDLMLPRLDGLEVCRRLRRTTNVPIIMLTARDEDVDKIVGLELGADDYVTKPFNPRELVARARAVLRRVAASEPGSVVETVQVGSLVISQAGRTALVRGRPLELRPREFDLLWVLATHPGQTLDREQLIERAWGYEFPGGTRTVDMHVAQLRKKLAAANVHDLRITTMPRVGYRLNVD